MLSILRGSDVVRPGSERRREGTAKSGLAVTVVYGESVAISRGFFVPVISGETDHTSIN